MAPNSSVSQGENSSSSKDVPAAIFILRYRIYPCMNAFVIGIYVHATGDDDVDGADKFDLRSWICCRPAMFSKVVASRSP
jgi:hypothetical protein